jgi:thiol-disulfide isomerase/thioredoxin
MKYHFRLSILVLIQICIVNTSFAQSNVTISGKAIYDREETITIDNHNFGCFITKIANATVDRSGNFQFKFNITHPQVIGFFSRPIYVTPGDSVFATLTGGSLYSPLKLSFKGRNADPYIYAALYDSLHTALNYKFFEFEFKNKLTIYLDLLNANKKILLKNLEDFSKGHLLTEEFKTYAFNQIVYDYYEQLLIPIIAKGIPLEDMPPSYSAVIDQINLKNDSMVNKWEYDWVAINYIEYIRKKTGGNELQLINAYSKGLTKEFLYTDWANSLISGYSPKDSLLTKELFEKIDKEVLNPESRKYFIPLKDKLTKYLTPLPENILLTALIDSLGHKLTFKDLLAKSRNKVLVLDFWASWCAPCRGGMPKVNMIKKNFNKKDVEFAFMSLDDTMKEWRNGMKVTKVPGNHYWITANFKSALAEYLKINSIPHYVIINKTGKFEKMDACSPDRGDCRLESEIAQILKQ